MPANLSAWLHAQRQSRGWNVPEMARQLRVAAKTNGDTAVPGNLTVCTYVRRWEHGPTGPSERYKLHYCTAFGITPDEYGPGAPSAIVGTPGSPAWPVTADAPGPPVPALPYALPVAYRGSREPIPGDRSVEREVLMAAHEGSEHAEQAERRDIGEATLEQLRADVVRLSHAYMTSDPFPLFMEMRRVRSRIYRVLDRQLWPRDQAELYLLVGCVCCLMADAADDLGYPQAAEELLRAGWAYAVVIDHRPLMAKLRLDMVNLAYWRGQARQASALALSGLEYLANGPTAVQLHLKYGRAAAQLGDADAARRAIGTATDAMGREQHDELLEIGGEFQLSTASRHYLNGSVLIEIPGAGSKAAAELEQAVALYAAGPQPGEAHGFGMDALAHTNLATAFLRAGQLDGALAAVAPVLSLSVSKRIDPLPQRLAAVRAELAHPRYQGSSQARELDERIEDFSRDTIIAGLHELPGTAV